MNDARFLYCGNRAKLATLHAEKRVIELIVVRLLGLRLEVVVGLNTNAFGSFNLGTEQSGSQLEVPKAKIRAVFERTPELQVGLARERSFHPHPEVSLFANGCGIVVLA